jgi:hypothetical protein
VPVCLTSTDSFWTSAFFLSSITIFFIIPLLILIVLYSVIAIHLMSNPTIISKHSSRSNLLKYRKQVIFMLIAVVASFFICMSPFRAFMIWIIVTPADELEQLLSTQRSMFIYTKVRKILMLLTLRFLFFFVFIHPPNPFSHFILLSMCNRCGNLLLRLVCLSLYVVFEYGDESNFI